MGPLIAWVTRNQRVIAGSVMGLILAVVFTLKMNLNQVSVLCVIFSAAAYCIKKRFWVPMVAWLVILPVFVYSSFAYMVETLFVRSYPVQPLPAVNAGVMLGGDLLRLHEAERCFQVTVCFYVPGTDLGAVAAHSCDSTPGQTFRASLKSFAATGIAIPLTCPQMDPDALTVSVVSDTDFGVVVSGLKCPETDREELPVGQAEDIRVGEEASIYSSRSGVVSCRILGFDEVGRYQMLVVRLVDERIRIGSGDSGSPVVQDGRIIGFVAGTWSFPYRGPELVLVRPACEVYSRLEADFD